MSNFIERWFIFCKERFSLARQILLIIFYVAANAFVGLSCVSLDIIPKFNIFMCAIAVLAIFLHLRIFDEIKDYKNDLVVHKDRPLARGLISVREAKQVALSLILFELCLAFFIGRAAFIAAICTVLYSLVMYKEFFAGDWLRPRMATYALTHTLVSCWLSVFVFSAVTGFNFWEIPRIFGMFVLVNWMIFNIFEFGRKTFGKEEEEELVESYSKRLGPIRAAFNVIIMATVAMSAAYKLCNIFNISFLYTIAMYLLYGLILAAAGLYAVHNDKSSGRMFRGICSIFILFYNVIISAGFLFSRGMIWNY